MSLLNPSQQEPQGSLEPGFPRDNRRRLISYSYTDASNLGGQNGKDREGLSYYWRVLSRRKLAISLAALLGAGGAFLLTLRQTPIYRAQTVLEVQNLNEDFMNTRSVNPTASSGFQSPEYDIRTQTTILQSRPVLERAVSGLRTDEKAQLMSGEPGKDAFSWWRAPRAVEAKAIPDSDRALQGVADSLRVQSEPNTRVIRVTFDSPDPALAADFANSLAESFIQTRLETRWQTSQHTVDWLVGRMQDVKTKLKNSEAELQRFATDADLTFLSEKDNVADERVRQLQLDLTKAQADSASKRARFELASSVPPESLPEVLDDTTLRDYQIQLTTLRRQLAELSSTYTQENPKIVRVKDQIATLEAELQKKRSNIVARIRNEYDTSRRSEDLLQSNYAAQRGLVSRQLGKVSHYADLKREVDTTRQLYDSMFQKVTEAGLASALRASSIQVIEKAIPPRLPYKPNFLLNMAFGVLSGVFLAIALIVQQARSDRRIREPGDTAFLNVPELGVIPSQDSRGYGARLLRRPAELDLNGMGPERLELTTHQRQLSVIAESFRLTLTSILFSGRNGSRPRVVVMSSANPREGKTTVISNLAIALAQADQRVLLVDGDMRRPRIHEIFSVSNNVGLGEVLSGQATLSVLETRIPNLFVLPSGHHEDTGILFKPELRSLLRRLKGDFDMILIDTPPMLQMPDARLFARHADAVILVVGQNTERDAVQLACQKLSEDGSAVLGTILNNWNPKNSTHVYSESQVQYAKTYQKD